MHPASMLDCVISVSSLSLVHKFLTNVFRDLFFCLFVDRIIYITLFIVGERRPGSGSSLSGVAAPSVEH